MTLEIVNSTRNRYLPKDIDILDIIRHLGYFYIIKPILKIRESVY